MAEKDGYLFPVLVEADWGSNISKSMKNKLLRYFQSPKRSGGGECKIHVKPGKEKQIVVYFAEEKVRQSVLGLKTHELDMSERKKLKLTVSLPTVEVATDENMYLGEPHSTQESIVAEEPQEPVSQQVLEPKPTNLDVPVKRERRLPESNASAENVCNEDQASYMANTSQKKVSGCPASVTGEMTTQEEFCIVIEPVAGKELEEEIVALYLENKKRSGGGPIKSCIRDGQQFIITFENKEDAQEVLQRKNHTVNKVELRVWQYQQQAVQGQPQTSPSLVLLENVQEKISPCFLNLLIENASGLFETDHDFSVEMIPEKDAAVITLVKPTEIETFVEVFNQHRRVQEARISARSLEVTKSILVENLPSDISQDYIAVYFESKKHGGGPVSDISYLPEENSAIVTFQDGKDVITVLAQNHTFNHMPVVVYPYYMSLGAALYGKQRPQIKMPDPVKVSLDPYHWQFLQRNLKLLHEMSNEMAACFCEIEWPTGHCAHPEITMHPSCALRKQKRSLVRTWKDDVSTQFAQILSKWKVVKCDVNAEIWEAIRNSVIEGDILILPDIPKGIVVLVGAADATDHAAQEMKVLIEKTGTKIEREKQTIEETVPVAAGKYTILNSVGLQDSICTECPGLKMTYNASKELVTLRGVAAEVFKIKGNILERVLGMVQKSVDVHPYIHLFLNHVDNETLSQLLFWAKKISAFYELKQEGVLLTAVAYRDLKEAEEVLKKELAYKCIELEDNSIIQMREWRELVESLYKACNCSSETIIIDEQEDKIVIAGFFKEVASSNQKLSDFVDNNTCMQKTIMTKSAAVTMYVQKEKCSSWVNLLQQGVKIHFGTQTNQKVISLEGPRREVLKGVDLFQNILSSLWATSMSVDRPGAKASFREQEDLYVTGAMQQFNCLIRIQEGTDENEEVEGEDGNVPEEMGQPLYEVKLKDGIVVAVHKGDLTRYRVDVVVNASNEDLKHIGGLADALSKVAGPQLQRECDDLVRKHGSVKPGCAIITSAWNLPCKQVIHAVGPRWNSSEKEKCTLQLKKAVKESLKLAETYNHRSIAVPAVSSGIFGFPLKECAHAIVTAIKEALAEYAEAGSLKQICLVDSREETVRALSDALREVFRERASPLKWSSSPQTDNQSRRTRTEHEGTKTEPEGITTPEGLKIILQKKGIEDATTNAVVNSVSRDLQLDKGPLSRALLGKAGAELQMELTEQGQGKDIKEGCVLQTGGYGLDCSQVLHAVLPAWDHGQTSQKVLGEIIKKCLKMTKQHSLNSITFPAVGTGNLRFPKPLVAKLMFDEVFKFSHKNPRSLQEVHFVLHPSDADTIKAFRNELKERLNRTNSLPESSQQGEAFSNRISTSASGTHSMQIGSITLQVECGDITQETTDVIVNISNETFNLKDGVSKAILEGAGPEVEMECALRASQPHNDLICTQGGNLKCKNVIHLVAQTNTKQQVSKALLECEQRLFTSVAFPAIGTGKAGRDPAVVADDMINAIGDFASQTPAPVVKCIKIVLFQPHLQAVFYASMQKKEATASNSSAQPSRSFFSKITEFFTFRKPAEESKPKVGLKPELRLERTIEPTIFQICGDNQKKVEKAESWIRTLILKNQDEIAISDEWLSEFGESEYEKMRELQQKLYVVIRAESPVSLRILGVTKDVLSASIDIQKMLKKIRSAQEEQSKADLFSNIVEWRYEDNGKYKPFGTQENMHIEFAAQQHRLHEVTIENKRYKVDPSSLLAKDDQGKTIALRRISKAEANQALPEEWEDMEEKFIKVLELNPETIEYQRVKQAFVQTCASFTIEKIERIQNPYKWQQYQIRKQEIDAKNGHKNNEKLLFHGTASTTIARINTSGFDRGYSGMHAAMYGNGTYFAVAASYSAHNQYSKPDANGKKYMYLARVLVGEYCVGAQGLVVPGAKNATDPTNLFDSVTDDVQTPSLFVIFNDIQAYPEYLITFKK